MSDEQKDAVIGRVARERSEAKKHLSALRVEAMRIGHVFSDIGRHLQTDPEHVVFEREPVSAIYSNPRLDNLAYRQSDINSDAVLKLTNEIRGTLDNVKILDEKAASVGIA